MENEIKRWLGVPGNKMKLALAMGYASTNAIDMWFQSGRRIPEKKQKQILSIIRGKK